MMSRRLLLALPLLCALRPAPAFTQEYPGSTIRFIVPTSPGSGTDATARQVAASLGKMWNAPVIVENKVGAGGNIGTDYVAKQPADGYTLLFTYASHYSNPLVEKTAYDPVKDFEPVARMSSSALVMMTASSSPFKSVQDVIAAAKQKPGAISFGTAGNGTTAHMSGALMSSTADIKLNHIPYKTPAQSALDTAGALVDLGFNGLSTALPLIRSGRLRPLAVTTAKRSTYLPDVPTLAESGLAGYDISSPIWVLAPRGTPRAIVDKLSDALAKVAASPEFKDLCATQGLEADFQDAAGSRASVPAETERWRKLVALTAAKPN